MRSAAAAAKKAVAEDKMAAREVSRAAEEKAAVEKVQKAEEEAQRAAMGEGAVQLVEGAAAQARARKKAARAAAGRHFPPWRAYNPQKRRRGLADAEDEGIENVKMDSSAPVIDYIDPR